MFKWLKRLFRSPRTRYLEKLEIERKARVIRFQEHIKKEGLNPIHDSTVFEGMYIEYYHEDFGRHITDAEITELYNSGVPSTGRPYKRKG